MNTEEFVDMVIELAEKFEIPCFVMTSDVLGAVETNDPILLHVRKYATEYLSKERDCEVDIETKHKKWER